MTAASAEIEGHLPSGICHLVIEVTDAARAIDFYGSVLGAGTSAMNDWPEDDQTALALPSGQVLAFKPSDRGGEQGESGVHQAYRCAEGARAALEDRLRSEDIAVHTYREDRPPEAADPFYITDPFGNRVQLVFGPWQGAGITAIDHAAVQASDMEWEEEFFVDSLRFPVDHRVGWNTGDYVRAQAWAEGKEDMAPGTRRMDRRYRDIPGEEPGRSREVARPNMQIFLGLGQGVIGIFLATGHAQEPAPELARGTPRTALAMDRAGLDLWAERLGATGVALEGPIIHGAGAPIAASLYFRDPCGNFFEFCTHAGEGS